MKHCKGNKFSFTKYKNQWNTLKFDNIDHNKKEFNKYKQPDLVNDI